MAKLLLLISVVLMFWSNICVALECYNCYSKGIPKGKSSEMVQCNEDNLTLSNTRVISDSKARCVYKEVEIMALKEQQTWRTFSLDDPDPCNPNNNIPGVKLLKCSHCGTDKCNLYYTEFKPEKQNNTFTFNVNINANINLRQMFL